MKKIATATLLLGLLLAGSVRAESGDNWAGTTSPQDKARSYDYSYERGWGMVYGVFSYFSTSGAGRNGSDTQCDCRVGGKDRPQ